MISRGSTARLLIRATRPIVLLTAIAIFSVLARAHQQPVSGVWTPAGVFAELPEGGASAVLPDGRLLIAGGTGSNGPRRLISVFAPASWSWGEAGWLEFARTDAAAATLTDGRVVVAGGTTADGPTTSIEVFDPESGSVWGGELQQARTGAAAATLSDGRVLIVGGSNDSATLSSVELFDPVTGLSTMLPNLLHASRAFATATTLLTGHVLVAGGRDSQGDLASAELFHPESGTFTIANTALTTPRSRHTALRLPRNGGVLIAGGTSTGTPLASAELYLPAAASTSMDFVDGTFAPTGSMGSPRVAGVAFPLVADGQALGAGGVGQTSAELYRFATIKTDKDDYAPGSIVTITGSGWQPGEWVSLQLQELQNLHQHPLLAVQASPMGDIISTEFSPDLHDIDVRFYLTAVGSLSGSRAQSTFTDGPVTAAQSTVVASPTSVPADNVSTSTVTVTLNDAASLPISGKVVTLAKVSGPGTPSITTIFGTTNVAGEATFTVRSATAGDVVFRATDVSDANLVITQTATITFTPVSQTVTFNQPVDVIYRTGAVGLPATASSGLAVTKVSNTPSVCTMSGANALLVSVGTCSITASQPGNAGYTAATPVTRTFLVLTKFLEPAVTAVGKVYDGSAAAPDATLGCTLTGVLPVDVPNVSCAATNGSFDSSAVGSGNVTATVTMAGAASANYTFGAAGTTLHSTSTSVLGYDVADAVYGQAGSFTSFIANDGGLSADSLNSPASVAFDANGNRYVSDQANHRVLFYPAGSGTATRVYGQGGSFTSNAANTDGVSADSLNVPVGVAVDDSGVYIADSQNNRVLFYAGTSTTATRVYGQIGSFVTNGQRTGPNAGLRFPFGLVVDRNGNLYVSDSGTARVLFFPAGSTTPTRVYGQGNNLNSTNNNYPAGLPTNGGFIGPAGMALDANDGLYVVDKFNSRILYFPAGSTLASRVYGHGGSFTSSNVNLGGISADSLAQPDSVAVDRSGNLYVSDRGNARVLFFTPGSTTATRVYGQAGNFAVNRTFFTTTAGSFSNPSGIALDPDGRLYVADLSTHRVVRFDVAPPAITAPALSVTLSAAGKAYDGTTTEPDASMSCALSGVLAADSGNVICTATDGTFSSAAAGPRTVTATVTISGPAAGNYTLGAAGTAIPSIIKTATASITARAVAASITAANKTYNASANATITSCTLTGVVSPDAAGCAASGVAANNQFSSASVGTGKTVTANLIALTNNAAGNYALASTSATTTANITTAAVTATITALSKTYDGTAAAAVTGCAVTGVLAVDAGAVNCAASAGTFEGATVGAGTVTATVTLGGASSGNYTLGAAGTTLPTSTARVTTDVAADLVYGQGGFTTNTANQPGLGATSLSVPSSAAFDAAGNLYMADAGNNRVLFYPAGSLTATRVYGQLGSFTSNTVNTGGVSAESLSGPTGVAADASGNLYIADTGNNRVLFYPAGQTTATRVYGQSGNFMTNANARTQTGLRFPIAVILDSDGGLYVSDPGNIRVLYFPAGVTTPTRVYGQGGNFFTATGNYPSGTPTAQGFSGPRGMALDKTGRLYVADPFNNRVLVFPAGSTTATGVYGQGGNLTTNGTNAQDNGTANSLRQPYGVTLDAGGNLYVADTGNHRVLFYLTGSLTATRVYGQLGNFAGTRAGIATASSLSGPQAPVIDAGGNLYIADTNGHRLLVMNLAPPVITAATLTATLTASGKAYDGTTIEPDANMSCTVDGVLAADAGNVTCTATNGTFDSATPGARTVTATVTISGTASGNYTLGGAGTYSSSTTATASATTSKAAAIITVTGYSVTYDGMSHTATGSALGLSGEDLSALLQLGNTTHTNAGSYVEDDWTFDGNANYAASGGFVINIISKATSTTTVTCPTASAAYTGAAQELCSATVTGIGGLNLTPTPSYSNNTKVGTATATYSYAGDANHDVSDDSATFTITKATLTVTANNYTRAALAANPVFTGVLTGVLGSDGITATYSAPAATLPGSYPITPALVDPNSRLGNYAVTSTNGVLTVVDLDPPVLTVPAVPVVVEATGAAGAIVDFADDVTAIDAVFGPVTVTCAPASGSTFALGTTLVQCTATDAVGNTGAASFGVTVHDTTAPTLTATDITVVATTPAGSAVTFAPMGDDIVDGPVASTCSPTSDTVFTIGSHIVTCSATDAAGNLSEAATFTVRVLDGVMPVVTVPAALTIEATGSTGATVTFVASATDNVDETLTTACLPASGSVFGIGETTVTCTASDAAGNTGTASFSVTVRDTVAPTLQLPTVAPVVSLTPTTVVTFSASALDIVEGVVASTCSPASGSAFPVGSTTVSCTAEDTYGNEAMGSFVVTVTDGVAPVVVVNPAGDRTVEATSGAGAVVTFSATATDNRDGALTATCSPASGTTFPIGAATLVTCSATDLNGNVGSTIFTVTVVDTTAPTLTLPAPISAATTGSGGVAVTFVATATDVVDGSGAVTCAPASGSTFAAGTTTVTCSASDSRGNTSQGSFTVTVDRQANAIGRFVAFSQDNTRLRSNVTVLSGDIGANEADRDRRHGHRREDDDDRDDITVHLGERVKMQQSGSRVVGDTVKLQSRASIYDVITNTLINRTGTVLGNIESPMQVPYLTMPVFPTITAGITAVTVKKNTSRVLVPGSYGIVKVEGGATLILTGGQYQMLSLEVGQSGIVLLRGPSQVLIKRELDTDSKAKIVLDQNVPGLMASQMVFYVEGRDTDCNHRRRDDDGDEHGPAVVHIGQQNVIQANIYAKNGTVWLMSKTTATGAFIGEHVRIGQKVTLTLDSAFR